MNELNTTSRAEWIAREIDHTRAEIKIAQTWRNLGKMSNDEKRANAFKIEALRAYLQKLEQGKKEG